MPDTVSSPPSVKEPFQPPLTKPLVTSIVPPLSVTLPSPVMTELAAPLRMPPAFTWTVRALVPPAARLVLSSQLLMLPVSMPPLPIVTKFDGTDEPSAAAPPATASREEITVPPLILVPPA